MVTICRRNGGINRLELCTFSSQGGVCLFCTLTTKYFNSWLPTYLPLALVRRHASLIATSELFRNENMYAATAR